jgi:hypothetical protein
MALQTFHSSQTIEQSDFVRQDGHPARGGNSCSIEAPTDPSMSEDGSASLFRASMAAVREMKESPSGHLQSIRPSNAVIPKVLLPRPRGHLG